QRFASVPAPRVVAAIELLNSAGGQLPATQDLVDKADSRAGVNVAVLNSAEAAAVPIEVHLADEEPAVAVDLLDVAYVATATCALHARLEDHCRVDTWRRPSAQAMLRRVARPLRGVAELEQRLILAAIPGVPGAEAEEVVKFAIAAHGEA